MADFLGSYNTSSSRTHVRFQFTTHAGTGAAVAPSTAFENSDLRIYKATDGAAFSATQRSSANGITMTSPFDSVTGLHDVDIDLTDNSDASFYVAGFYSVVLSPDETVDSVAVVRVLAYFEIGPPPVNVTQWLGTAAATPATAGIPDVNAKNINNVATTSVTTVSANVGTTQPVNFTGTGASALAKSDMVDVAGSAVSTSTAQLGVNAVQAGGTAWGSGAITAASIATDAIDNDAIAANAVTEIQSGLSTLDAAGIRTAVGLASANLDTQLGDLPTNAELATALGTADDAVLTAIAALNNLSQANIRTAVGLGSANLDTQLGDLPTNAELATALGTADDAVLAAIAALNNLSQANIRTAVGLTSANLDTQLSTIDDFLDTEVAAILAAVDTEIAAIKTKTDSLTFTVAGVVDANVQRINDVTITGDGSGTPFGV